MDTKTGLDVLKGVIALIEAKQRLQDLRYSIMSWEEQMLEDIRREERTNR